MVLYLLSCFSKYLLLPDHSIAKVNRELSDIHKCMLISQVDIETEDLHQWVLHKRNHGLGLGGHEFSILHKIHVQFLKERASSESVLLRQEELGHFDSLASNYCFKLVKFWTVFSYFSVLNESNPAFVTLYIVWSLFCCNLRHRFDFHQGARSGQKSHS